MNHLVLCFSCHSFDDCFDVASTSTTPLSIARLRLVHPHLVGGLPFVADEPLVFVARHVGIFTDVTTKLLHLLIGGLGSMATALAVNLGSVTPFWEEQPADADVFELHFLRLPVADIAAHERLELAERRLFGLRYARRVSVFANPHRFGAKLLHDGFQFFGFFIHVLGLPVLRGKRYLLPPTHPRLALALPCLRLHLEGRESYQFPLTFAIVAANELFFASLFLRDTSS